MSNEIIINKPRLCVFTPTYNRATILGDCYQCLLKQSSKDFQWMIIDDGSVDNTESIVRKWIEENLIDIQYIKKENQGKIRAIEDSLRICENPLWLCLDSDDTLFPNAIETILSKYDLLFSDAKCCGLYGVRYTFDGTPMQGRKYTKKISELPEKIQFMEGRYKYRIPPEYCLVYKTDIIRKYKYPHFGGEKFIPESSVYCLMDNDGYYYYSIKKPLMTCEYRDDGLSNNYYRNVSKYPRGYTYTQGVITDNCTYLYGVIRGAICYQAGRILGGNSYNYKKQNRRIIAAIMKPMGYLLWKYRYSKYKDVEK